MLQCLPFVLYFPPDRVFPSLFLLSRISLFPVCTSFCVFRFAFLLFLICFCFFWLRFIFFLSFLSASLFFAFPWCQWRSAYVFFLVCGSCSTPLAKRASLKSVKHCAFSCVSFLDFLLSIASLPHSNVFSLFPLGWVTFSDFLFRFFTSSCYFHPVYFFWVFCGLLGFCGGWTAYRMYLIRTRADLPFSCFCLRCACASVIVCTTFCLLYFFTEVFLPLQSYWSLFCDHGLHCIVAMS